jgi:hypothetical protein
MPRRKAVPVKLETLLAQAAEASREEEVPEIEQEQEQSVEETIAELDRQTKSGELFPLVREHPLQRDLLLLSGTGGFILGIYFVLFLMWLTRH